ncbi:LutC/YkgG family protein [Aurantivibrio plasticivorans]
MTSQQSRYNILAKLRSALHQHQAEQLHTEPDYQTPRFNHPIEQFTRVLKAHHTQWEIIPDWRELPLQVAGRLQTTTQNTLHATKDKRLTQLDWQSHQITLDHTPFSDDHQTVISIADVGIAETGTLVVTSDKNTATTHSFLAEHHIIVIEKNSLVDNSETAWKKLNTMFKPLPRAVNFISGPSSSADVGLKLEYGAHGPRTLCVYIVDH